MSVRGIDVASYQSRTPDLDGFDFCFVKATEGTWYINPKMRAQADHARKAGRVVGFYHFLRPGSMTAQARYFVEKCASLHGDPLWCDWEDADVSCADKDAFLHEVLRLRGKTHRVGLYCNTNFWLHRDTTSYCGEALWIAVYNGRPGRPGIRHPWRFHQYTSSPIDTSISTFSSRAELRAWAEKGAPAAEEDDMPISDADVRRIAEAVDDQVWNWDGIDPVTPSKSNPKHQAENVLTELLQRLDRTEQKVDDLTAQVTAGGGITAEQLQAAAEAGGKAGARTALAELGEKLTKES